MLDTLPDGVNHLLALEVVAQFMFNPNTWEIILNRAMVLLALWVTASLGTRRISLTEFAEVPWRYSKNMLDIEKETLDRFCP